MGQRTHEPGTDRALVTSGRVDAHAHYVPKQLQDVGASVPSAPLGFASCDVSAAMAMMDLQVIATTTLSMVMWLGLFGGR